MCAVARYVARGCSGLAYLNYAEEENDKLHKPDTYEYKSKYSFAISNIASVSYR